MQFSDSLQLGGTPSRVLALVHDENKACVENGDFRPLDVIASARGIPGSCRRRGFRRHGRQRALLSRVLAQWLESPAIPSPNARTHLMEFQDASPNSCLATY